MSKIDFRGKKVLPNKVVKQADNILDGARHTYHDQHMDEPISYKEITKPKEVQLFTLEALRRIYPKRLNEESLEKTLEIINTAVSNMDSVLKEHYRDNLVNVIDVLKGSRQGISFEDYVNAVKFCTHKMAGESSTRAYALTFPDRVIRLEKEGIPVGHLHSYASGYARNRVVVEVLAKMQVPDHILYQDYFHLAVKTQVEIMTDDSVSPKVRSDAANSLMTHLKQPEVKKAELSISTSDTGVIGSLADALNALSGKQRQMLSEGKMSVRNISEAVIIEVEPDERESE